MSYIFDSRIGEQLYQLLPEVYRTRDKKPGLTGEDSGNWDLAKYLDAHGHLLDLIHETLKQQLSDGLPGSCQYWLVPYFARLLAANIVSPELNGRHAELKYAVSWRQRKGTLKCAEEIAEAVGQMEVEIQEGWKRVAITPRIGMPIIPAGAHDETLENLNMKVPSEAKLHPELPAVTVDLRRPSRAVRAEKTNPAARISKFSGVKHVWRQANSHGVPCFPGSFDDVSRRTVDIRTNIESKGYYHHKHLLAYAPPPTGLFPRDPVSFKWSERNDSRYVNCIEEKEENGIYIIRNYTDRTIEITDDVELTPAGSYRVEGLNFNATLSVVEGSTLELRQVEANKVMVTSFSETEPVLVAKNCLFDTLSVGSGTAELDSCTILTKGYLYDVDAEDCIFMDMTGTNISGNIQYCRIPAGPDFNIDKMTVEDCTSDEPEFFNSQLTLPARAVLATGTPKSIYAGASDAGEIGYYHNGRKERPVRIENDQILTVPGEGYSLQDVVFLGNVEANAGEFILVRTAAKSLTINTALSYDINGDVVASLEATDCLFDDLTVGSGLARLEYCTIMHNASCRHLQASDCIFAGEIQDVVKETTETLKPTFLNCLRYSSINSWFLPGIKTPGDNDIKKLARALQLIDDKDNLTLRTNTLGKPIFSKFYYCKDQMSEEAVKLREPEYNEPGYGVLDPVTPDAVRFGAEDGGEIGAYHNKYYSLKAKALLEKMREFLPVSIEPILIIDAGLTRTPPGIYEFE